MRVLVLSDSHSTQFMMREAVQLLKPDTIIHLGDYVRDGQALSASYPQIPFIQLPGNCDLYQNIDALPEIRVTKVGGVAMYMSHGHRHGVKTFYGKIIADARACGAKAVLFGHTHEAYCERMEDGLWVLNPGSCGIYGGSVGLMEIEANEIHSCVILRRRDLEEML